MTATTAEKKRRFEGGDENPTESANMKSVSLVEMVKLCLWENLLVMNVLSGKLGALVMLLNTIQSFGIPLNVLNSTGWDRGYAGWIVEITDGTLLQSELFGSKLALFIAWAVLGSNVLIVVAVGALRRTDNRDWTNILLRSLSVIFHFCTSIFFFPLASLFGSHTTCQSYDIEAKSFFSDPACWHGQGAILPFFSIIAFLFTLFLSVVKNYFLIETIAYDTHTLPKAHGRLDALEQIVCAILIYLTSALRVLTSTNFTVGWVLAVLSILGTGTITVLNIFFGPYYYEFVQKFKSISSAILTWTCVCVLVLEIFEGKGYEPFVLLYFCSLLIAISTSWLVNYRRRILLDKKIQDLSYPYEVEMKIRFFLERQNSFWTRQANTVSGLKPNVSDDNYREANVMFKEGMKKFPESVLMCASYASFLFGKGNYNYCLTIYSKAKRTLDLDSDIEFLIFKKSKEIEAIFSQQKGSLEVIRYFRFLELNRVSDTLQKKFTARKLALLAELKKSNPNPKKVQTFACDFQAFLYQTQAAFHEMFSLNPAPKVLRRYASFVSNIIGHMTLTKQIVELADKIEAENQNSESKFKTVGLESQSALFDEKNAVFVISGEESRLGEILEVNLGAVDMFGFATATEMVGSNISTMMSSPFSENHNGFLRKYLETGYTSVLDLTRTVVARDKSSFLFEVRLYVRQLVDTKGNISFIGVMSKNEDQPEFIIIDGSNYVHAVSKNIISTFGASGFDSDTTSEGFSQKLRQIHISQWLTTWDTMKETFYKEQGHTMAHKMTQMHVKAQRLDFIGSNFSVIELWVDEIHRSRMSFMDMQSRENIAKLARDADSSSNQNSPHLLPKSGNILRSSPFNDENSDASSAVGGLSRRDSIEGDAVDAVLQNTAINMINKFDQLIQDYRVRMESRQGITASLSRFWFKVLGIGLVVWLIASNIQFNSLFFGIRSFVDDLENNSLRDIEAMRVLSSIRSVQINSGCRQDDQRNICSLLKSVNVTYYDPAGSRKSLSNAAYQLRVSNHEMIENIVTKRSDENFFFNVAPLFEKEVSIRMLRHHDFVVSRNVSILESMELMSTSADFVSIFPNSSRFYVDELEIVGEISNYGTFQISEPAFYRSLFYLMTNVRAVRQYFDDLYDTYQHVFDTTLGESIDYLLALSIVPVVTFLIFMALFVIPDVRKLVVWQADILTTMLNIPRSLIQWWYSSLLKRLEEDAKEEEDGVTAELYMYLQQGEIADSHDESSLAAKISVKEKTTKAVRTDGESKVPKQTTRMRVNAGLALKAMNQKDIITKMIISSLFLVSIPLISLVLLPALSSSHAITAQLDWFKHIIVSSQEIHFDLREAFLFYGSNDTLRANRSLDNVVDQLQELKLKRRNLIYGDPETGIAGLGDETTFKDIFFGNTCKYFDPEVFKALVIREPCDTYENGIMTYGANQAMIEFEKRALDLLAIIPLTSDQVTVAKKIANLEALMNYNIAILLSTESLITETLLDAAFTSSNVIQPIQIVLAIVATFYIYLRIYMPFMRELEHETKSMNSVLLTLWSVAESSMTKEESKASKSNTTNNSSADSIPAADKSMTPVINIVAPALNTRVNQIHFIDETVEEPESQENLDKSSGSLDSDAKDENRLLQPPSDNKI